MPNYTFKCTDCAHELTLLMTYSEMKNKDVICPECYKKESFDPFNNGMMVRILKATSTAVQTKEVIDNGLMTKRVERLDGITEMIRQRADDNDKS